MNHKELERWYRLRNIKRASQFMILLCSALVVSGYAASVYFRPNPSQFPSPIPSDAGIRIENFSYSAPGPRPWELHAPSAVVSESLNEVTLQQPQVIYHGGEGGSDFASLSNRKPKQENPKCHCSRRCHVKIQGLCIWLG